MSKKIQTMMKYGKMMTTNDKYMTTIRSICIYASYADGLFHLYDTGQNRMTYAIFYLRSALHSPGRDVDGPFHRRLRRDPAFAAQEQARARRKAVTPGSEEGLKPVYCDSRYYKILAGGNSQGGVGCGGQ